MPACERRSRRDVQDAAYDPGVANLVAAWERAKAAGDGEAMAAAALALAANPTFGGVPGGVPALLFEARSRTDGVARTRLAAALARAWAYSGQPARAAGFAAEAQADAERRGDPTLLADALDAQLAVHWGPDQLADRLRLTDRLEETTAHVTDVEARLSAHLWRFSTGLEILDSAAVRRQLRALDLLADGVRIGARRVLRRVAPRHARAAHRGSRRRPCGAGGTRARPDGAAGSPDVEAVEHTLRAGIARQAGDTATLVAEARNWEGYGLAEGIRSITAWAADHWVAAGHPDRARTVLHQLADFATIPRDVDWLLTVYLLTDVAAAVGERAQTETGLDLLTPYAGRGVIDAGGVAFAAWWTRSSHGQAPCSTVPTTPPGGRRAPTPPTGASARPGSCTRPPPLPRGKRIRRSGRTTLASGPRAAEAPSATRPSAPHSDRAEPRVLHLRPGGDGIWWVGRDGGPSAVRDVRGLHYLHLLLSRPGLDVPALALSDAVAGNVDARAVDGDAGPLLDRQALAAYRRRLGELDDELAEARAHADLAREQRLDREREALLDQLRAATGLGGRARVAVGTHERARVAVRKAIAAAIDRITAVDPSLGRLLIDTISTGATCRYDPDPDRPMRWIL